MAHNQEKQTSCTHPDGFHPFGVFTMRTTGVEYAIWKCRECGYLLSDFTLKDTLILFGFDAMRSLVRAQQKKNLLDSRSKM